MYANSIRLPLVGAAIAALLILAGCGEPDSHQGHSHGHDHGHGHDDSHDEEYERGSNGGRLLREADFAVEITIFESGVPPKFHVYPYIDDQPVDPADVELTVELERLDGTVDRFSFAPENTYLSGDGVVTEPHSFDIRVAAKYKDQTYNWAYGTYEGRTTISDDFAQKMGVRVEPAGPAVIDQTLEAIGRVQLAPGAEAMLKARFPGQVIEVYKTVGDRVSAGEVLARIDKNASTQHYDIVSPIDGVVIERNTSVGDIAQDQVLFTVGDLTKLHVDFHIFPKDLNRVAPGQAVNVRSVDDRLTAETAIQTLLPTKELETQTVLARARLDNPDETWMPGMTVSGEIVTHHEKVPLAVRTQALQRFRDFTVVYAKIGETYEVRMLELGRQTAEWTEVLGGIKPGQPYVTENSFLIKADVGKSGASHDH